MHTVVAGVAVPEVAELRGALALALDDEVESELAGLIPGGLATERLDELPRDLIRAVIAEQGRRTGKTRDAYGQ
jgi:hypothetical protein